MRAISILAIQEQRDTLSNRWLIGFGVLFAVLTVAISYFGLASSREIGFQGFGQVSASLLDLVLFTVPLVSLLQPVTSLTGEGLEILLTQPLERSEVLLGKYLGMLGSIGGSLLGGLLSGGLVIGALTGMEHAGDFLLLALLTFGLVCVFSALGTAVAIVWRDRARALGIGLAIWFALTIVYDLVVSGLTVSGPGFPLRAFLLGALLANPIDAARVFYLLATDNTSFVGVTGAILAAALGSSRGLILMAVVFIAQVVVALGAAMIILRRKDF